MTDPRERDRLALDVVRAARDAGVLAVTYYDYSEKTDTAYCLHCRVVLWTLRNGETGTPHRDDCAGVRLGNALAAWETAVGDEG